jgi:hypothetical protein
MFSEMPMAMTPADRAASGLSVTDNAVYSGEAVSGQKKARRPVVYRAQRLGQRPHP